MLSFVLESELNPCMPSTALEKILSEKTPSDAAKTIVTFLPNTWNRIGAYEIETNHYLQSSRLVALFQGYFLLATHGNVQLHKPNGSLQEILHVQNPENLDVLSCIAASRLLPDGQFCVAATLEKTDNEKTATLIKIWHVELGRKTPASSDVELFATHGCGDISAQSLVFSSDQDAIYLAAASQTHVTVLRSNKKTGNFEKYLQLENLPGSGPWSSAPFLSFPASYLLTCLYYPFLTAIKLAHTTPMRTRYTSAIESSIATIGTFLPPKIVHLIEQYAQLITKTIHIQGAQAVYTPCLSMAPSDYRCTLINTQMGAQGSIMLFDGRKYPKGSEMLTYQNQKMGHVTAITFTPGMIAIGFSKGTIALWEQSQSMWHYLPSLLMQGGERWGISLVSLSSDGNALATLTFGGKVAILQRSCVL
jgi:WD40 repeat protein